MAGQPPTGGGVAKAVTVAAALLAPPTVFGWEFRAEIGSHPVQTAVLVVVYWLAWGVVGLVSGVGRLLMAKWQPRLADAIDRSVMAMLLSYRTTYLKQLSASIRDLELLGVVTQGEYVLRLQDVYVELGLAPQPLQDTAGEPFVGRLISPGERRTLDRILDDSDHRVFAVIGGPGSGKTTLLRRAALDGCRTGLRRRPLPILLYLRDHNSAILAKDPPDLADVAGAVGWLKGRIPADWIRRRLQRGGCLVLLDGLDEVTEEADRRKIVAWVKGQTEPYPENDYVITSRPHGYRSNPLGNANVLQVRRFTGEQISRFLHGWYNAIEARATNDSGEQVRSRAAGKADDLLAQLRDRPALYDLAANPLLLTMIANVHRYRDELPESRAALYGEMCQMLLYRRHEAKGLSFATGLRGKQKEHLARTLALHMMTLRISHITEGDARRAIAPVLQRVSSTVAPQSFLTEARNQGLLVERERGVYGFAHLTLQEYLAAVQIRETQRDDLLTESVDDPWWREATRLWAAGADATPVIAACLNSNSVQALTLAFECAEEALETAPEVREKLEKLLVSPRAVDDPKDRLITAVKVSRSLGGNIRLEEEDTLVGARPVTRDIYALFVREETAHARYYPAPDDGLDPTDEAAVGIWPGDAARCIAWLNGLFDDGTAFRLPTRRELRDPAITLVTGLNGHSVWTRGDTHPDLYCPDQLPHPYVPQPDQMRRFPALDRERMSVYLFLAFALELDRDHPLARALDDHLADARDHGLDLAPESTRVRDLVLDLAPGLDRDRTLDLDLGPIRDLADVDRTRARYRVGSRARECVRDLVVDRVPASKRMVVVSYHILVALWVSSGISRPSPGQALAHFDAFLAGILPETPAAAPMLPEDAVGSIQRVRALLEASRRPVPGRDGAFNELACRIIDGVHELVAPIVARSRPYDPGAISCARIGLLATAALVHHTRGQPGAGDEPDHLIHGALRGLTAMQERFDGGLTANDVLLLVRA